MNEITGDLWSQTGTLVVPTNGVVNTAGELVMGAGVALQARKKYPDLPREAGKLVGLYGNTSFYFPRWRLATFPERRRPDEPASLELIRMSAERLLEIADRNALSAIYLPRVGCGLGGLDWFEVKSALSRYLDGRFVVVSPEE